MKKLWKGKAPNEKFREKETQRVYDFIEKSRAFHEAQEPRYEAQRQAKRERVAA